jgi:hypothetical protein
MRISIAQQCRNQLSLECTVTQSLPQVTMFASFLRHWAGLAKTLELNWDRISLPDVEGLLNEALQAAAVTDAAADAVMAGRNGVDICTGPLQVKSVKANVAGPLLLGQLPASTLTCLELGHVVDYACECAEPASSSRKVLRCIASIRGGPHTVAPVQKCAFTSSAASYGMEPAQCMRLASLQVTADKHSLENHVLASVWCPCRP